jgi:hypothetical protein
MTTPWVLIVFLNAPSGVYVDKYVEGPIASQQLCEQRVKDFKQIKHKDYRFEPLCVTQAHWEGTKPMPGVAMD